MQNDRPRLSIGLPVYNGQRFLRATLDAILAQTFTDFELIICDNCSSDATEQICREYAARDHRVRYVRNERNIGPAPNYNRCFEHARGEYFKWSAADDLIAPDFLEKCVSELDRDPKLIACYTRTREIDADGQPIRDHIIEPDLLRDSVSQRLRNFVFLSHKSHAAPELWSVIRADVLRRWKPVKGSFPSADRLVVTRLALAGPMKRIDEFLFFNRDHVSRSVKSVLREKIRPGSRLARYVGCGPTPSYEWWDATKKGKIVFPEWRWLREYFKAVHETSMSIGQKLSCYMILLWLTVTFIPRLGRDVIIGTEQLLNRITGLTPQPACAIDTSASTSEVVSAKPAGN